MFDSVIPAGWALSADGIPELAIYDLEGNPRSLDWLNNHFGAELDIGRVDPTPVAEFVMRLVELRLHEGPCAQMVKVAGLEGEPFKCAIARWWRDAPELNPFPADCIATRWRNNALTGWTDPTSGVVGFGMGKGDMPGSSAVFPIHCLAPADYLGNLGWMPGTNHRTIVPTFKLFRRGEPTPPPGPSDPALERIATAVETMAAWFKR